MNYRQKIGTKIRIVLSLALLTLGGYHLYRQETSVGVKDSHAVRAYPTKAPHIAEEFHFQEQQGQALQCYERGTKDVPRHLVLRTRNLLTPQA